MSHSLRIVMVVVALGLFPARPALAQEDHTIASYGEYIRETVIALEERFVNGDHSAALADLRAFNAEVDQYEGFMEGDRAFFWPDLMLARLLVHRGDFAEVVRLTAPILVKLDTPEQRSGGTRMEAHYLMARALFRLNKFTDAEPVLRNWYHAAEGSEHLEPYWETWIDYMLARVTTWHETADANDIRARVLEDFTERDGATNEMYQMLIHEELQSWREDDEVSEEALLELAGNFETWLSDLDPTSAVTASLRLVGLVYAEAGERTRAHPLFEQHRDTLAAEGETGGKYFWAVQNVLHNLHDMGQHQTAITQSRAFFADQAPKAPRSPEEADALSQIRSVEHRALKALNRVYEANSAAIDAYRLIRTFRSANHPDALSMSRQVEPALVPASHPFAQEFTTWESSQTALTMTPDGEMVIGAFLDGNYLEMQGKVAQTLDDPEADPALMALTSAYHYGLLGDIQVMMASIEAGRAVVRSPGQHALPANTHLFDLIETLGKIFARQSPARAGIEALTRLEARKDLPDQTTALVRALRILFDTREGNPASARRGWDRFGIDMMAHVDMSHIGVLLGLVLVDQGYIYGDATLMDAYHDDFTAQLQGSGRYALARVIAEVFRVNSSATNEDAEGVFQRLGVQISQLSRMLPDEHQWSVATRVNYAFALQSRRQFAQAADLFETTALSYRESPSHRTDVYGFFEANRAWTLWFNGEVELAQSIIDQVYRSMDPDTWDPAYVFDILHKQAVSLNVQDRTAEAMTAMDTIIYDKPDVFARMDPTNQSLLMGQRGIVAGRLGQQDEARKSYDQSVQVLPSDNYQQGWPMSRALYNRAIWIAQLEDHDAAYTDMAKSNALWFAYFNQDPGLASARDATEDRTRVVEQARLGWELARTLDAQSAAKQ